MQVCVTSRFLWIKLLVASETPNTVVITKSIVGSCKKKEKQGMFSFLLKIGCAFFFKKNNNTVIKCKIYWHATFLSFSSFLLNGRSINSRPLESNVVKPKEQQKTVEDEISFHQVGISSINTRHYKLCFPKNNSENCHMHQEEIIKFSEQKKTTA